jgi:hypothetical protein
MPLTSSNRPLDFYFEAGRTVPAPSKPKRDQHMVELPASIAAKVLLLNEMIAQKVRLRSLPAASKSTRRL